MDAREVRGNSGVFVWTTPAFIEKLSAAGKSGLPDGIEVQILDHGFTDMMKAKGAKTDWFGANGDVFPVRVKMTPFPPLSPDGIRSFPRKHIAHATANGTTTTSAPSTVKSAYG